MPKEMPNEVYASFRSRVSELKLTFRTATEYYENGRIRTEVDPKSKFSGIYIQFHNGFLKVPTMGINEYGVKHIDIVQWLLDHKGFGKQFFADPTDPGGYWTEIGLFKPDDTRRMVKNPAFLDTLQHDGAKAAMELAKKQ